jgi:hypothetical protein
LNTSIVKQINICIESTIDKLLKGGNNMFNDFDYIDFYDDDLPACDITVEQWDSKTAEEQEEYIKSNNIKVCFTHDITDTLTRGFGEMDFNGFWEYTCKQI